MGEFVPFDKDHEDEPAFPNCLPAGFAVGLAGEKAAQAGDATPRRKLRLVVKHSAGC